MFAFYIRIHILLVSDYNIINLALMFIDLIISVVIFYYHKHGYRKDHLLRIRESTSYFYIIFYQIIGKEKAPVFILIYFFLLLHYLFNEKLVLSFYISMVSIGLVSSYFIGNYSFIECINILSIFTMNLISILIVEDVVKSHQSLLCEAQVSKAKADLFYEGSHEFRNPLQALIYSISYLKSLVSEKKILKIVDEMKTTSSLLSLLMENILDYSKMIEHKLILAKDDVDLHSLVQDIAVVYMPQMNEKNIEFSTYVDPNIPMNLLGDYTRITQIISNFTCNALKFTKNGEILISCELLSLRRESSEVKISVKDTGVGIEQNSIKNLFIPFEQVGDQKEMKGWVRHKI